MLDEIKAAYPWPAERPLSADDAFSFSLDGGGRDILTQAFDQLRPSLMIEIGSLLGGSALQWLIKNPKMHLVCVDPWADTMYNYIKTMVGAPWAVNYGDENLIRYASLLQKYGTLPVVQNNLWDYRDRVTLIRSRIQECDVVSSLRPDMVFIDAMKERDEFDFVNTVFPDAMVCGDDWNWIDKNGKKVIQMYAQDVANSRGGEVYAKAATFLIDEPRFGLSYSGTSRHWLHVPII
ncbi:hypothetical protein [Aquabacter spiritensis]|uniref:Methyltransferase family protein n=1 Tax=Aquabacter spiritensis TaxID=933073 RepID=A0A4R3LTY9_9HYPH|nr:hypothetical protein [Aquabacter spiritensis]TCT04003.1 hypothetical protein EDC64_108169 [Aquabacter spiritensis]